MRFRLIARLRYDDRSSDISRDAETAEEIHQWLMGNGWKKGERDGATTRYTLPTLDNRNRPTDLVGYLIDLKLSQMMQGGVA